MPVQCRALNQPSFPRDKRHKMFSQSYFSQLTKFYANSSGDCNSPFQDMQDKPCNQIVMRLKTKFGKLKSLSSETFFQAYPIIYSLEKDVTLRFFQGPRFSKSRDYLTLQIINISTDYNTFRDANLDMKMKTFCLFLLAFAGVCQQIFSSFLDRILN